jgi:16S rRNA pseudouridine516 synthase
MEVLMEKMRLDKIIADAGLASRREAAQLIKDGFVTVDGRTAASGAEKYDPDAAAIAVAGRAVVYSKKHYLMMNKPAGVVSATEDRSEKTVLDLLGGFDARLKLFPAGRLDKDAEGLLILTDDGEYAHRVISPSKNIWKTYYVETDGELTDGDARAFGDGIVLKDGLECLPAVLEIVSPAEKRGAYVRIREGKYHQVKRMLASRGKPVTYLKRVSVGGLKLDENLAPGAYRAMTEAEIASVFGEY